MGVDLGGVRMEGDAFEVARSPAGAAVATGRNADPLAIPRERLDSLDKVDNAASAAQEAPLVRLAGVSKSFDGQRGALAPTDLEIRRGDLVGLIGPSGCGKTTLLRLMAGLLQPTTGRIEYGGAADRLAFVFQDATLLPWLTVRDNVALPLRMAGVSRKASLPVVDRTLALVGLTHAAGQYPRELSGGMKMRTSIARALTRDPELLLLDEPFGALDEMSRDHLNEELLRLREQSLWTAVFVTHSVAEAVFLASRVVVLSASPGQVDAVVPVPLPYPRTAATRGLPEYAALVLEVTRALHAVQRLRHDAPAGATS